MAGHGTSSRGTAWVAAGMVSVVVWAVAACHQEGTDHAPPVVAPNDAGLPALDATPPPSDATPPPSDAAPPPSDASSPPPDASPDPCTPGASLPAPDEIRTLVHDGLERTFRVHVPPGYDGTPTPLVVNFHGLSSNPDRHETISEMTPKADAEGFIVVYPSGTGLIPSWNGGSCCGYAVDNNVDDIGFTVAMLDELTGTLCIDEARIYAAGISNGGFLAHRLACELADRIAAIAPVAGVMGISPCTPSRPMPVLDFHGTADLLVPYDGGLTSPSVAETIAGWVERNGCTTGPVQTFLNGDSHCESYGACNSNADVTLCTVEGGGHTWPGGWAPVGMGYVTEDLHATDAMWDFFVAHPMP